MPEPNTSRATVDELVDAAASGRLNWHGEPCENCPRPKRGRMLLVTGLYILGAVVTLTVWPYIGGWLIGVGVGLCLAGWLKP